MTGPDGQATVDGPDVWAVREDIEMAQILRFYGGAVTVTDYAALSWRTRETLRMHMEKVVEDRRVRGQSRRGRR